MSGKEYKNHNQKLVCLKDMTSQKMNKKLANNLQSNAKTRKK